LERELSSTRSLQEIARRCGLGQSAVRWWCEVAPWNGQGCEASVKLTRPRRSKVWVYTIDEPDLATRLLDRGVDGIITNNPALIDRKVASQSGK